MFLLVLIFIIWGTSTSAASGKKEWEEGKEGEEKGGDGEYPPFAMMESGRERKEKGVVAPQGT